MSTVKQLPRSIKSPVLVLGATDGLGTGLVEAGLEAGYPVIAVGEDRHVTESLHERFAGRGRLFTLQGAAWTNADAAILAGSLQELPLAPLLAIVNIPLTCERGRLLDQDRGLLERVLHREVIPQMNAARHLLPLLAKSGRCARYLVMGGPNGDTSWVGYGHHSVAAAATRMLIRALRRETEDSPVRVQQLVVGKPVRTEQNARYACPEWPDALSIGRYALKLLTNGDSSEDVLRFESEFSAPHDTGLKFSLKNTL